MPRLSSEIDEISMTGSAESPETAPSPASAGVSTMSSRPEELPPVQPPSAGYIVQLFLIPALIVAAVIGVWALFGMLADSETDSQQLVAELGSSNQHRRWRAATGLAYQLQNQQIASSTEGTPLAQQPDVAKALTDLLKESVSSNSTLDADINHQEFLARTLGSLDVDEIVLPTLAEMMTPDRNVELRKSSLMALSVIAGRHFRTQAPALPSTIEKTLPNGEPIYMLESPLEERTISDEALWEQLKLASQDENPSIRHLAGFALGLVSGDEAIELLEVMLLDNDPMAQANAATGLALNGNTQGVKVITRLLQAGTEEIDKAEFAALPAEEQARMLSWHQGEQPRIVSNCLRAVDMLWPRLSADQQTELRPILKQLADDHTIAGIRMQASTVLNGI